MKLSKNGTNCFSSLLILTEENSKSTCRIVSNRLKLAEIYPPANIILIHFERLIGISADVQTLKIKYSLRST